MQNIGSVLKYISSQKFQLSPGLLTFHNYLQHMCDETQKWDISVLNRFFNDCLVYPHWIQNRVSLTEDLKNCLENFEKQSEESLHLEATKWPTEIHVIEIENKKDFSDLINAYLRTQYQKVGSKYRLVFDSEKMIYAILLHPDQTLTVRQFDRRFTIREGFLEPLRTDLEIHYNTDLNIEEDMPHKIEVAPFVTCLFSSVGEFYSASLVRGYYCQKFHEFKLSPLDAYPRLFFALRRIEKYFIRQESNPYYLNLTQELERTLNLLRLSEPLKPSQVTELQVRVQNALDFVFHGDKLLRLLLRDLENQMAKPESLRPAKVGVAPAPLGQLAHLDFIPDAQEAKSTWFNKNLSQKTTESDLTNLSQIVGLPLGEPLIK